MKNKKAILTKMILIGVERATTPQTGWAIYQKIKRKISTDGNDICVRMHSMYQEGLIKHVGHDVDGHSLYVELTPTIKGNKNNET